MLSGQSPTEEKRKTECKVHNCNGKVICWLSGSDLSMMKILGAESSQYAEIYGTLLNCTRKPGFHIRVDLAQRRNIVWDAVNIRVAYRHSESQEIETLPHNAVNIKVLCMHSESQEIETLRYNSVNIKIIYISRAKRLKHCFIMLLTLSFLFTYTAIAKRLKHCLIILLTLEFCTYIARAKTLKHCLIILLTLRFCTCTPIAKRLKHCLITLLALRGFVCT